MTMHWVRNSNFKKLIKFFNYFFSCTYLEVRIRSILLVIVCEGDCGKIWHVTQLCR